MDDACLALVRARRAGLVCVLVRPQDAARRRSARWSWSGGKVALPPARCGPVTRVPHALGAGS